MGERTTRFLAVSALIVIVGAVFTPTLSHDFVDIDDGLYITRNSHVPQGLSAQNIAWAFTTLDASNWHPLTWLSYFADVELFGMEPEGFHRTNLILHLAATLALLWALNGLTGAFWPSLVATALFAVHPLRVESVAWIAERKDVLSGVFAMLTLGLWGRYSQSPSLARYLAVAFALALGLMSKPMLVTLPCVLLLLDYWPLGRLELRVDSIRSRVVEKLPLFGLALGSSVVTWLAQVQSGALASLERASFSVRIANALVAYPRYLEKTFWPADLAVLYPLDPNHVPVVGAIVAGVLLGSVSFALVRARSHRFALVGWLWFLGTLVPVIGLVQVGTQAFADRYTYFPSVGLCIALVWAGRGVAIRAALPRAVMATAATLLVLTLGLSARQQTHVWRDAHALMAHAVRVSPQSAIVRNNLGKTLARRGELAAGIDQLRHAIRIWPRYVEAHTNLGNALLLQGDAIAARQSYEEALRHDPNHKSAHHNLANLLLQNGDSDGAARHLEQVLRIDPGHADAHYGLGIVRRHQGRHAEATRHLEQASGLSPL